MSTYGFEMKEPNRIFRISNLTEKEYKIASDHNNVFVVVQLL